MLILYLIIQEVPRLSIRNKADLEEKTPQSSLLVTFVISSTVKFTGFAGFK